MHATFLKEGLEFVTINNPAVTTHYTMVKLSLLAVIGTLVGGASATSNNFGPRTFVSHRKNNDVKTNAADVLSIRGGHQYEDIAKKAYYLVMASQGIPTALAPEKTGDILFNGAFSVDADSLGSFLVGYAGSSCEYIFILCYILLLINPLIIIILLKHHHLSHRLRLHGHARL